MRLIYIKPTMYKQLGFILVFLLHLNGLFAQGSPNLVLDIGPPINSFTKSEIAVHLRILGSSSANKSFVSKMASQLKQDDWTVYMMLNEVDEGSQWQNRGNRTLFQYYLLRALNVNTLLLHAKDQVKLYAEFDHLLPNLRSVVWEGDTLLQVSESSTKSNALFPYANQKKGRNKVDVYPRTLTTPKPEEIGEREFYFVYKTSWGVLIQQRFVVRFNLAYAKLLDQLPSPPMGYISKIPVSKELEKSLLLTFEELIEGLSHQQALEVLMAFCSTEFRHKNDFLVHRREVFAHPEQTFYYQWSDCEDRSILLGYLNRKLLGLETVVVVTEDHVFAGIEVLPKVGMEAPHTFAWQGKSYTIFDPSCPYREFFNAGLCKEDSLEQYEVFSLNF